MKVVLQEESLWEGLQTEGRLLSLAEKLEIVRLLVGAGVRRLQLGGFANPRSVPQAANTDALASLVRQEYPELLCSAFVYNEKGLERAHLCGLQRVSTFVPVSDTDSRRHGGRPMDQYLKAAVRLIRSAVEAGFVVQAGIRSAFGCVYEGGISTTVILETVDRLVAAGATSLHLADTAGLAHPHQVRHLAGAFRAAFPDRELVLHLHDTRGLGLVNIYAGYEAGVRVFDVAAGGLGSCIFVQGAPGNVATEDAVHLFEGMGVDTGIDLGVFCRAVTTLETLLERQLSGRICRSLAASPGIRTETPDQLSV